MEKWTPYILALAGALIALFAYIIKQLIAQGNRLVAIETAFKYYIETTSKGAAMVLNSANPAPPEIRRLLSIHTRGKLSEDQREELAAWLRHHIDDHSAPRDERGVALQLLAGIEAAEMINA